ncbi:flagellar hook-length control protein FliK [Buchnera aphidicola]|nr:flagellar hook-length control protein FliK [Buchnera aphidicola]
MNNLLKKNICYDEYVHIILDCMRTIFSSDFHIYSKYDDYIERKNYCSFHDYNPDSMRSYYMPLIYKKLLTCFSKNKKIVKLSLNVQHLGTLLIRLEIKKNKFLKLDLVSNNSITQKVLTSDISTLRNIIFKNGMKFNEIVVRNPNIQEIILLNKNSNCCSYTRNIMNIMSKKKIKRLY